MVDTSSRGFAAPLKYIQGRGEYENMERYTSKFGKCVLFIIDCALFETLRGRMEKIYSDTGSSCCFERFSGECTKSEAERLAGRALEMECGVIVAMGGGKTLDTGKLAAHLARRPIVIAPTAAASDAPATAVSVLYGDDGKYAGVYPYYRHPELVVVDSEVVASAPLRLIRAGMGDAMATYYESLTLKSSDHYNYVDCKYRRTIASMALARAAYDVLIGEAKLALMALENGLCNEYVEDVIEANTLLSGVGSENCGDAGAHRIYYALTRLPSAHKYLHGELVAFGILCQLALEKVSGRKMDEMVQWLHDVGLPVTLKQIDVDKNDPQMMNTLVNAAAEEIEGFAEPIYMDRRSIYDAILMADVVGSAHLETVKG